MKIASVVSSRLLYLLVSQADLWDLPSKSEPEPEHWAGWFEQISRQECHEVQACLLLMMRQTMKNKKQRAAS